MKELTIQEKAKAYDESLERAKEQLNDAKVFDYDNEQIAHDIRTTVYNIFPELKESKDDRIRKEMISWLKGFIGEEEGCGYTEDEIRERIAWLDKQGEHANFRNKIQIGDHVTRNDNGELVNLSQLERVAKQSEPVVRENKGNDGGISPNSAWSEEDEAHLDSILKRLEGMCKPGATFTATKCSISEDKDWLKSLKDRVGCEVKEVDFERELSKYVSKGIHRFFPNEGDDYYNMDSVVWQDYVIETAKHFFELGLKAKEAGYSKPASKDFTFKSIPRILEMVKPSERAKSYCEKLAKSLENEGYPTDAKIVRESIKMMNGEKVPMATMDEEPVSEDLEEASKEWLRPQLDMSYINYGEGKMMELTHFDGYAMLDAIEFGAKWKEEQMMKNVVLETTIIKDWDGCAEDGNESEWLAYEDNEVINMPEWCEEGDKVKLILIKSEQP